MTYEERIERIRSRVIALRVNERAAEVRAARAEEDGDDEPAGIDTLLEEHEYPGDVEVQSDDPDRWIREQLG